MDKVKIDFSTWEWKERIGLILTILRGQIAVMNNVKKEEEA